MWLCRKPGVLRRRGEVLVLEVVDGDTIECGRFSSAEEVRKGTEHYRRSSTLYYSK